MISHRQGVDKQTEPGCGAVGWISPNRQGQQGMILVSALFIVAAASLIAVGLASDTTTDFRIAGNRRVRHQNFLYADAGLNMGIQVVRDFALHVNDHTLDPAVHYPASSAVIPLNEGGSLSLTNLALDPQHLLIDLWVDTESEDPQAELPTDDNAQDSTDPNLDPDIAFDVVDTSDGETTLSRITLDMDYMKQDVDSFSHGDIRFASGYDRPPVTPGGASSMYFFHIQARATDMRHPDPHRQPYSQVGTVYRLQMQK